MKRSISIYCMLLLGAIYFSCSAGPIAPDIGHRLHQVHLVAVPQYEIHFVELNSNNVTPVALHEPIFALSKWHFGFPKTKNSFFGGRLIGRFGEIRGPPKA